MNNKYNWLVHDHSEHEELLAGCQDAVEMEDWKSADLSFGNLIKCLKAHIELEEEILFPAFESRTEGLNAPTESLRDEHNKIVRFISDTLRVIETRNSETVQECLAELERMMVKHHEKEEDIFLPMASLILEADRDELVQRMRDFNASRRTTKWEI